jgi:hypothetical protein
LWEVIFVCTHLALLQNLGEQHLLLEKKLVGVMVIFAIPMGISPTHPKAGAYWQFWVVFLDQALNDNMSCRHN